jgi:hypothetical protein
MRSDIDRSIVDLAIRRSEMRYEKGCYNHPRKAYFRRSTATVSANDRQMRMEVGC